MARTKKSTVTFQSREEFQTCIDEVAALQLKIDQSVAEHNAQKAAQDKAFKTLLKTRKEKLSHKIAIAESYCAHHRDQVLGSKQTSATKLANFGYRVSPGILKPLNTRWTFAKCLQALKEAGMTSCIKVTESLKKDVAKSEIPEADLASYGLRVDYPEEFWIEAIRHEEPTEKRLTNKS